MVAAAGPRGAQTQFNQANAAIAQAGQQTALNNSWNQDIAGYNARMGRRKDGYRRRRPGDRSTIVGLANGGPLGANPVSADPPYSGTSTMAQAGMTYSQQVRTQRTGAEGESALTNLNQGTCAITLIRTWPTPGTRLTETTPERHRRHRRPCPGCSDDRPDDVPGRVSGDAFILAAGWKLWSV